MKAFVTGATGFVGGHLVDRLLAAGDEVTALVRSPAKAAGLAARGVRLVRGDLEARDALREAAAGADVVYHVAALVGAVDEAEFLRANREGTASVVAAVREVAVSARFVQVSSLAAAGPAARGRPRAAHEPEAPVTMYGRSKLAAEQVVRESGLRWVIVRPPAVYGPRDADNFITLFRALRWGVAPIFGDGTQELSLVHVEDLAAGIRAAGVAADVERRAWFVHHPEVVTSADVVRGIARELGRGVTVLPLPRVVAAAALGVTGRLATLLKRKTILRADKVHEFFAPAWTGDVAPFLAATGWQPRFDLAAGLAHTHAWYREAGWL